MWTEPLTAISDDDFAKRRFEVFVLDARPVVVASVLCAADRRTRCGVFGEMNILDATGGPKQKVRALVLLVREALRHADELGLATVHTDVPDRLLDFAQRMSGLAGVRRRNHYDLTGDLADIRTHALETSDGNGDLRG